MSIEVHMSPLLTQYTSGQYLLETDVDTIRACLRHLEKQFSKLILFEKDGRLLSYLSIYVNGEITTPKELDRPVTNGDELDIMLTISGG
jgi:molybdopterin converting factor small subunit